MLKTIDKYIIGKFLTTFFYTISLFIAIIIVFDVSEKIQDFIDGNVSLSEIVFEYYLNFIPFFVNLFSPLFTFISVIFFTSRMAANTEIVAILNSGMSFRRMLVPYLFSASLIAALSVVLNNFVIPAANEMRLSFEEKYINRKLFNMDKNIHRQIDSSTYLYFESFDNYRNIGYKFSLENFSQGRLTRKLLANNVSWDSSSARWLISDYYIRHIDTSGERIEKGAELDTVLPFNPAELSRRVNTVEMMDYGELNDFIEKEKQKGAEKVEYYMIEKHRRFAFPFATIILTLIGVCLSSRKTRGGIGMHIGLGLVIAFSYILFMQVSTTFATHAYMPPMASVWVPNILYALLALFLLKHAPD